MKANIKKIRHKRRFTEDFKRHLVKEYERGQLGVLDLEKLYQVGNNLIYSWIYKYSNFNQKSIQVVEMKQSSAQKIKQLEAKVKELERAVGQKQLMIDYLEKMMDLAKDELGIDIKKNSDTPQSTGSSKTKKQ